MTTSAGIVEARRGSRRLPVRIVAAVFAFVFWLPSLAVGDLVVGLISDSNDSQAMANVAYGVIGSVLIAPAFISQISAPDRKIAPLQQVAVVAIVLAVTAVASGEYIGLLGVVVVLVPLLIVLALHPRRADLARATRPHVPLLALVLVAAIPALVYAWHAAASGRAGLPPENSFAYVPSFWAAVTAMALGTVLVALVAAFRSSGWLVSAACAGLAALLFGVGSLTRPTVPASGGVASGAAAIVWGIAWFATALRLTRTERVSMAGATTGAPRGNGAREPSRQRLKGR